MSLFIIKNAVSTTYRVGNTDFWSETSSNGKELLIPEILRYFNDESSVYFLQIAFRL